MDSRTGSDVQHTVEDVCLPSFQPASNACVTKGDFALHHIFNRGILWPIGAYCSCNFTSDLSQPFRVFLKVPLNLLLTLHFVDNLEDLLKLHAPESLNNLVSRAFATVCFPII